MIAKQLTIYTLSNWCLLHSYNIDLTCDSTENLDKISKTQVFIFLMATTVILSPCKLMSGLALNFRLPRRC